MDKMTVAAIQMTSGSSKEKNLQQAKKLIIQASKKGACFIALPEVFNYRGDLQESAKQAEAIPGYSSNLISKLAKENKKWILIGSMLEKSKGLPFNTSVLINPKGKVVAKYRKMHLFDIKLKGKKILESSRNQAGEKPVLANVGKSKIGLSVCYDLRFPELYRFYSNKGCEIICIPSSFIKPTGIAHWHILIRARAIENFAYVIAPNQAGVGSGGIKTFGHSLIVDPWGKILAEGPSNGEGIIFAEIDLKHLKKIRTDLPALDHRKIT